MSVPPLAVMDATKEMSEEEGGALFGVYENSDDVVSVDQVRDHEDVDFDPEDALESLVDMGALNEESGGYSLNEDYF